jgi:hypothetical protein
MGHRLYQRERRDKAARIVDMFHNAGLNYLGFMERILTAIYMLWPLYPTPQSLVPIGWVGHRAVQDVVVAKIELSAGKINKDVSHKPCH